MFSLPIIDIINITDNTKVPIKMLANTKILQNFSYKFSVKKKKNTSIF
jgi:hypothetical protein